jgi:hypothetical protein
VISWIPISVAFSRKQSEAVIHFVGQQLYASDISILAFFSKEITVHLLSEAKVISVSNK